MCYTAIIISLKDQLGALGWGVLMNTIRFTSTNPHGFGIRVDDIVLRTLDVDEFKNFVLNNRSKIENSKLIHLHYRFATSGKINTDNVHLWEIGGYYVSHNGSINGYGNTEVSDSLEWFTENEENIEKEDLDALANSSSRGAWGVFLLSKKDLSKIIVGSVGKQLQVFLLDDILVLSSATLDYRSAIMKIDTIDVYGFSFTITRKITSLPKPKKILKTDILNEWRLIDLAEKKLLKKATVQKSYTYNTYNTTVYSYTLPYTYSYDDNDDNCKITRINRISWGDYDE